MLLLSMTRHLTQDVAPVPFLWVLPLSIYLLSFILCFDAPRYYARPLFLAALPLSLLALDRVMDGGLDVPWLVALLCGALFVCCMVCHGELVRRKPPVRYLTLFYLMLSIGGALGGLAVVVQRVGVAAEAGEVGDLRVGVFSVQENISVEIDGDDGRSGLGSGGREGEREGEGGGGEEEE